LKCLTAAKGGYYYKEHLPLLGETAVIKRNTKVSNRGSVMGSIESNMDKASLSRTPVTTTTTTTTTTAGPAPPVKKSALGASYGRLASSSSSLNLIAENHNGGLDLNPNLKQFAQSLKINDPVNIDIDFEVVQSLQVGHGGWSDGMFECLGTTGVIVGIDKEHDYEVRYPSGNKWTFNPAVLTLAAEDASDAAKVYRAELISFSSESKNDLHHAMSSDAISVNTTVSSADLVGPGAAKSTNVDRYVPLDGNVTFMENELVEINTELEYVRFLQRGHGEWADSMIPVYNFNIYSV
jgi:hypothetical protein